MNNVVLNVNTALLVNSVARQYEHELWLKREAEAQKKFKKQRELEEKVKADREEREVCM